MTDFKGLYEKILSVATKNDDFQAFNDLLSCLQNWVEEDKIEPYTHVNEVLGYLEATLRLKLAEQDYKGAEAYRNLIYLVLKFSAPVNFDHYMQALEYDRKPKERFYLPRRKALLGHVKALQDLADGKLDELFLSQPPRTGKALADDTPILTRNGWKNHGDLEVGDEVVGMDGKFKKVIAVHPKCQLDVLMEFTNGEKIQCHENHEWLFEDRRLQRQTLEETKYYEKRGFDYGEPNKRGHRYMYQLPKKDYVIGEEKNLPLDPYTLGVWLGDGANNNPRICGDKKDEIVIDTIVKNGYSIKWKTEHKATGVMYYEFDIRKALQSMNMCHSKKRKPKYIPDIYLTASISQRLELLAGLIDTDGTFRKKENRYVFTTCEESLRDTFIELISTFGWRTGIVAYEPSMSTSNIQGRKNTYAIGFNPDCEIPCKLARKQNRYFSKRRAISLKNISRVEPKQGNCITVEGDGMYLAGKTMIPTHNTTLNTFFMTWIFGRNSELSNLYVSFSDTLTNSFYQGLLEVINDPVTYHWHDIFQGSKVVQTNAKDETINIDRRKKYPSITCRSLYGTLNGACDCSGFLIADDLLSGIEEAMNPDRLVTAWNHVDNNMLTRAKSGAKVLWIGTRWSIADPIGRRLELLQNDAKFKDRRYKVINIPALNENDESNFEYKYELGFDTDYFHQRRASFEGNNDMASWFAQYQGEPIEREGTLFTADGFKYYNGVLPDKEPDRIFMAVDPAFGGGDYTSAPIVYQYGQEFYVVDVVYDNGEKTITQPLLASKAKKHNVQAMQIEATKATMPFVEGIQKEIEKLEYHLPITTKAAPTNIGKEQRIFDKAPDIRDYFYFLDTSHRSKEYNLFMQNIFSFKIIGKNKHDDAPDSMAMVCDMAFKRQGAKIEIINRPF